MGKAVRCHLVAILLTACVARGGTATRFTVPPSLQVETPHARTTPMPLDIGRNDTRALAFPRIGP